MNKSSSTCPLLALAISISISTGEGASVSFTPGPSSDPVLLQAASGSALAGAHIFAGSFDTVPSVGIGFADVSANFDIFAGLSDNPNSPSTAFGFIDGGFDAPLEGFESERIFLLVLDTDDLSTASEFALLSSPSWVFQSSETDNTPTGTTLEGLEANEFFAGSPGNIDIPGAGSGFSTIQLEAIPEPSVSLLCFSAGFFLVRRKR